MVENSNSAYSPSRRPIAHPRAARVIPGGLFTVQKQTPAPFTRAGVAPLLLFLFVTLAQRTSLSAARLPLLTPLLACCAPFLTSLLAGCAPLLASLRPRSAPFLAPLCAASA